MDNESVGHELRSVSKLAVYPQKLRSS